MTEKQAVWLDVVLQVQQAGTVRIGIGVTRKSIGSTVDLHGVAYEYITLPFHHIRHRASRVTRHGMHRDRHIRPKRYLVAMANHLVRFHFAGDGGLTGRRQLGFPFRVVDIAATRNQIFFDMGAARTQERRICLVDDDFGFPAGQLP